MHSLVLNDRHWEKFIALAPPDVLDWRKKDAQNFRSENARRGIITILQNEYEKYQQMALALKSTDVGKRILGIDGFVEMSVGFRCAHTGVWLRTRPDYCPPFQRLRPDSKGNSFPLVDLKFTDIPIKRQWAKKNLHDYGLALRAAIYWETAYILAGQAVLPSIAFCLQEIKAPFSVQVQTITPYLNDGSPINDISTRLISCGRRILHKAKTIWAECKENDDYYGIKEYVRFGEDLGEQANKIIANYEKDVWNYLGEDK